MDELKDDGYNVKKVDVTDNMEVMEDLSVSSLPCVLVWDDGDVIQRFTGVTPPEDLVAAL
jgi:thioredoxin-like negative regulator of GroEL